MKKLKGDYNLGVYNPPSSLDAVRFSEQAPTELALQLNNLKAGQETGYKQQVATSWPKFLDPNIDLINYLNNFDIETFIHMLREGWRDEMARLSPAKLYTTPPFSPEIQLLIQPRTPVLPPYPDPDNPPPFEEAPSLPPNPPFEEDE